MGIPLAIRAALWMLLRLPTRTRGSHAAPSCAPGIVMRLALANRAEEMTCAICRHVRGWCLRPLCLRPGVSTARGRAPLRLLVPLGTSRTYSCESCSYLVDEVLFFFFFFQQQTILTTAALKGARNSRLALGKVHTGSRGCSLCFENCINRDTGRKKKAKKKKQRHGILATPSLKCPPVLFIIRRGWGSPFH